jgi:hypothetical protein
MTLKGSFLFTAETLSAQRPACANRGGQEFFHIFLRRKKMKSLHVLKAYCYIDKKIYIFLEFFCFSGVSLFDFRPLNGNQKITNSVRPLCLERTRTTKLGPSAKLKV